MQWPFSLNGNTVTFLKGILEAEMSVVYKYSRRDLIAAKQIQHFFGSLPFPLKRTLAEFRLYVLHQSSE